MDPLYSLARVRYLARDGRTVVDGASLDLFPGQRWAIVGEEACGKSQLLRLMAGVVMPAAGQVMLEGQPLSLWSPLERVQRLGVVFAMPDPYFLTNRVGEEVSLGISRLGLSLQERESRLVEAFHWAGLPWSLREEGIMNLSASQRYRVSLAAVLTCQPRLLLLDEPAALLSQPGEEHLAATLRELCQRLPMTTVIFSGRWPRARLFADHLLTLQQGKLLPADDPS